MPATFQYPQDRAEIFEPPTSEEISFQLFLIDFQDMIAAHGVDRILNNLPVATVVKIMDWCDPNDFQDEP